MNTRKLWSRISVIVGGFAMLVGAIDPVERAVVILAGSGLVALGTFLGQTGRQSFAYCILIFFLIAVGVGAMFVLSAFGGIGGNSGHSMWWGVLILPFPAGWIMGMVSLLRRLIRGVRHRDTSA